MTVDPTPAFAAYGRAMASVAAFEQIMRLALGEHETGRRERAGETDPETLQRFTNNVIKLDFGGLTQRVCHSFKLEPGFLALLKEAKVFRNYFAHDFWSPNYGNLRSDRGIAIIVRHSKCLERQMGLLSNLLVQSTGVDVAKYLSFVTRQIADDAAYQEWENRLKEAEAALAQEEARQRDRVEKQN